jgi:hypothetical protein
MIKELFTMMMKIAEVLSSVFCRFLSLVIRVHLGVNPSNPGISLSFSSNTVKLKTGNGRFMLVPLTVKFVMISLPKSY